MPGFERAIFFDDHPGMHEGLGESQFQVMPVWSFNEHVAHERVYKVVNFRARPAIDYLLDSTPGARVGVDFEATLANTYYAMMKALTLFVNGERNPENKEHYTPFIDSILESPVREIRKKLKIN